jgi:hypothetical protein
VVPVDGDDRPPARTGLRFAELRRYLADPAPYVAAGVPGWLDELDFRPSPPHLKMGTRSLDLDRWLVVDEHHAAELAIRRRLLEDHPEDVFGALAGTEAASAETLALVTGWLGARGGPVSVDAGLHPLAAAGMLVQEDLCVMVRHDDGWHLDAAILCFPTLWLLADKLGRVNADVHAPVPHFAEELLARVDGFFDRLRPGNPVWRRNFSVMPDPMLCIAAREFDPPLGSITVGGDGDPLWLRSERQTLRRLPRTGAILFTIKVQIAPAAVLRERPDRAADLAAMYASWDTAAHGYKMGGDTIVPALRAWLTTLA